MNARKPRNRKNNIPVYEHLDIGLKCSYAHRLQWLEEANDFVRSIQKIRKKLKPTSLK